MTHSLALIGNGGTSNKGCEALLLGTIAILRRSLGEETNLTNFHFPPNAAQGSAANGLTQRLAPEWRKFSRQWLAFQAASIISPKHAWFAYAPDCQEIIESATAMLMLGGDNFTLDYGVPRLFYAAHEAAISKRIPLIAWGATIGPFSKDRAFEKAALNQLAKFDLILARESETERYLNRAGIRTNVRRINDPAFCMSPEPAALPATLEEALQRGAIGVNLSPLVASHRRQDVELWVNDATTWVETLANNLQRPIILVPHVVQLGDPSILHCDNAFLSSVHRQVEARSKNVFVAPGSLTAPQVKWLVSRLLVFAGTRMHATVASVSSCIPTLFLAYSAKAVGMARDIYGHNDMTLDIRDLTAERLLAVLDDALHRRTSICAHLSTVMPDYVAGAWRAGDYLAETLLTRR